MRRWAESLSAVSAPAPATREHRAGRFGACVPQRSRLQSAYRATKRSEDHSLLGVHRVCFLFIGAIRLSQRVVHLPGSNRRGWTPGPETLPSDPAIELFDQPAPKRRTRRRRRVTQPNEEMLDFAG